MTLLILLISVTLAWTDNSTNELGFHVERSTNQSTFVQIAEVGQNITGYEDLDVQPATPYVYRVRAWNAAGVSAYSNEAGITLAAAPSVLVEWQDLTNPPGTVTYNVYRSDLPCAESVTFAKIASGLPGFVHVDLTVSAGIWCYRLTTERRRAESLPSDTAEATVRPGTPTAVKVTVQ